MFEFGKLEVWNKSVDLGYLPDEVFKMNVKQKNIALIISELIKRMSPEEKVELVRHISWEELEEWKATQETLPDSELMANLKRGLEDEQAGRVEKVKL